MVILWEELPMLEADQNHKCIQLAMLIQEISAGSIFSPCITKLNFNCWSKYYLRYVNNILHEKKNNIK